MKVAGKPETITERKAKPTVSEGYRTAARATSAMPASLLATERIARGGVSPIPAMAAAYGLTAPVEQQGIINAGAAHANFSFHG